MELLLLSAQLQDCYNAATVANADDLTVYQPVVGQAYVACADDRLWYRAQALGEDCMCLLYSCSNCSVNCCMQLSCDSCEDMRLKELEKREQTLMTKGIYLFIRSSRRRTSGDTLCGFRQQKSCASERFEED